MGTAYCVTVDEQHTAATTIVVCFVYTILGIGLYTRPG